MTLLNSNQYANNIPTTSIQGILSMASTVKVWCKWRKGRKRWEVGFRHDGKLYQFYSWEIPTIGQKFAFTEDNHGIALQFKQYVESLAAPDPKTGICRFDPCKLSKTKKSRYALSRLGAVWLKDYEERVLTGDCSAEYVDLLKGYLHKYIYPVFESVSVYEIDAISVKEFYLKMSTEFELSKKHVQNIMDAFRMLLLAGAETMSGFEMPKFPKYREKKRQKVFKWLLESDQWEVARHVEPEHQPIAMTYLFYGMRMSEAINLRRADYIMVEDHMGRKAPALNVKTLKGGPDRVIQIFSHDYAEHAYGAIKSLLPATCGYLFHFKGEKYNRKTLYKIIHRALVKAGFGDMAPKDAGRHSRASNLATKYRATAFEIQYQLGHSDIRTSAVYTHLNQSTLSQPPVNISQHLVNSSLAENSQDIGDD